jgi:hypothetical protein
VHPADGTGAPAATVAVVVDRVDRVDGVDEEADPPALEDEHPARHTATIRVAPADAAKERDGWARMACSESHRPVSCLVARGCRR